MLSCSSNMCDICIFMHCLIWVNFCIRWETISKPRSHGKPDYRKGIFTFHSLLEKRLVARTQNVYPVHLIQFPTVWWLLTYLPKRFCDALEFVPDLNNQPSVPSEQEAVEKVNRQKLGDNNGNAVGASCTMFDTLDLL